MHHGVKCVGWDLSWGLDAGLDRKGGLVGGWHGFRGRGFGKWELELEWDGNK